MKNSQNDPISLGTRTNIQGEKKKSNQVTTLGKGVFQHSTGVHLHNKICQRGGKMAIWSLEKYSAKEKDEQQNGKKLL